METHRVRYDFMDGAERLHNLPIASVPLNTAALINPLQWFNLACRPFATVNECANR